MDTQVPIKRKSSRRTSPTEMVTGGMTSSNIPTYVAIGAAGLALGIGYLCMKKIQQQQTDLVAIKEKEKKYETFQNQIKQLEENNQLLVQALQKSEITQKRLGTQLNSIHNDFSGQPTTKVNSQPVQNHVKRTETPEHVKQKPPMPNSVPRPTQVKYVEPSANIPQEQTPQRIVLSAEDKIPKDPPVHL